ncbi:MAG TPA: SulP family inorganic anion transporter [Ohtaekwangia sp.]|nr:SulP family inorganic anion transporter [Ohtaekwangia sp.]
MKRTIKYYRIIWLKHDLPAGLSVFLVALPLCLGIALASGAPLYAGILSGIIGGLMVSVVSGSQLAVSGPAAGLTTLVAATIATLGDYRMFLLAVVIAGIFQLALGMLKLGGIANYFPSAVIKGMLAAIGLTLILKQIPTGMGSEQPDFWKALFPGLISPTATRLKFSNTAILITVISMAILLLLQHPRARKVRVIPAPLLAVLAGVIINLVFLQTAPGQALGKSQMVNIPDNLFTSISFPDFSRIFATAEIWKAGITIGLLATIETLLCIEAIDKLDRHNRITPVNRELVAQGVGNITCGLLGAIPLTAVIVRGAANADAGGRTKLSAFTHGLFLLLAVMLVPYLLNMIPYASLAAILIVTGFNLTKPKLYVAMWRLGWKQFIPFMVTVVVILFTDLLIGVTVGLLVSAYYIVQNNFRAEYKVSRSMQHETVVYNIKLNTNVTFLNKVKLRKALDQIPEYSVLTIDGSECNFIDHDILEIISEYHNKARDRHIELHTKGIRKVNIAAVH